MEDIPLYNSRLIKNYIEYLRKFYPQIDPNDILEYAGIESYELEESGQWLSQRQVDRFHEMLNQLTRQSQYFTGGGTVFILGQRLGTHKKICLWIS